MKKMLLKNVLKGLETYYDVEQLTIINEYKICFSGSLTQFNSMKSIDMCEYRNKLLNSEVIAKDNIGNVKHFIFIRGR